MPIIKSSIKKVRKDKNRTERNRKREAVLKTVVKKARKDNSPAALSKAFSALDKAVKVNLIHKNKASRLKSRLSKGSVNTPTVKRSSSAKKKKK